MLKHLNSYKENNKTKSCYKQHDRVFHLRSSSTCFTSWKFALPTLYTKIFSPRATSDIQDVSDPVFVQKITKELPVWLGSLLMSANIVLPNSCCLTIGVLIGNTRHTDSKRTGSIDAINHRGLFERSFRSQLKWNGFSKFVVFQIC